METSIREDFTPEEQRMIDEQRQAGVELFPERIQDMTDDVRDDVSTMMQQGDKRVTIDGREYTVRNGQVVEAIPHPTLKFMTHPRVIVDSAGHARFFRF